MMRLIRAPPAEIEMVAEAYEEHFARLTITQRRSWLPGEWPRDAGEPIA